jgi:heme ABC exporter ATP-binding subunit CcmA
MINVQGLCKAFGTTKAVDGLSFHVSAGEVYALLGRNGAGKTTTLRILTTLSKPDEGTVTIDGLDIRKDPLEVRRRLAYVPAEAGLPPRLSPREVVRLFARIQGVEDPIRASDELLERLGAADYADLPCEGLSTGMKRRVVLARALVHNPKILLLDEPTDGLDVPGRRHILDLVSKQAQAGRAVVISSHVLAEVERVGHRIGVMDHGSLVAEGTTAELLENTATTNLDDAFLALVE